MKVHNHQTEWGRSALALAAWDNEGGASGRDSGAHQYGRRIETDRSWTIYHVFTGVPAVQCGEVMTGLNRSDATDVLVSLNDCNEGRQNEGIGVSTSGLIDAGIEACTS